MGLTIFLAGILFFFVLYGKIATLSLFVGTVLFCAAFFLFEKRFGHQHGGFLSIDMQAQRSRLGRYHPGLKTCFATVCALLCVAADSLVVSGFVIVTMLLLTVCAGGTSLHYYLSLLTVPVAFILLGTVAILFEVSPAPLGLLDIPAGKWYICVTAAGQAKSLSLMGRAFGAVSCLYLLSLSTPVYQIIGVLRRARIPAVVTELMVLIYRYIFVLLETQNHMHTAAQARLGYRNFHISIKTMLGSSLNLLFLSFRRSSDCFTAMESRCYDDVISFWEEDFALQKKEMAAATGYVLVLAALWLIVSLR